MGVNVIPTNRPRRTDPFAAAVGRRLADALKMRGKTRVELSEELDVSGGAVTRWTTGENRIDLEQLTRAARFLGVRADWLAWGEGSPEEPAPTPPGLAQEVADEIFRRWNHRVGNGPEIPKAAAGGPPPELPEPFKSRAEAQALEPVTVAPGPFGSLVRRPCVVWVQKGAALRPGHVAVVQIEGRVTLGRVVVLGDDLGVVLAENGPPLPAASLDVVGVARLAQMPL